MLLRRKRRDWIDRLFVDRVANYVTVDSRYGSPRNPLSYEVAPSKRIAFELGASVCLLGLLCQVWSVMRI